MADEEDDEKDKRRGRPNSYFASKGEGYDAAFRGVPLPKAGPQDVMPADVIGDYDTCHCGLPADHDWPGKSQGRKHPRKAEAVVAQQEESAPRIEKKQLRAYHDDLTDVIIRAVNDYGIRYRLSNNSIVLYPRDGSPVFTINARSTQNRVNAAQRWFARHVAAPPATQAFVKDPEVMLIDMDLREKARLLAEQHNGPEHPVPEALEVAPEPVELHSSETDTTGLVGDWKPYVSSKTNQENERWEQSADGVVMRCRECGWMTDNPRGMGPHWKNKHDPEEIAKMYGTEAQDKKVATREVNRVTNEVRRAIKVLTDAVGDVDTKTENDRLKSQMHSLQLQVNSITAERDEAVAKLALIRESLAL